MDRLYGIEFNWLQNLNLKVCLNISKWVALCSSAWENEGSCSSKLVYGCFANHNCNMTFCRNPCPPSTSWFRCLQPRDTHSVNYKGHPEHIWKHTHYVNHLLGARKTYSMALKHCINMSFGIPTAPFYGAEKAINLEINMHAYQENGAFWFQNTQIVLATCELPWHPQFFYKSNTQFSLPLLLVSTSESHFHLQVIWLSCVCPPGLWITKTWQLLIIASWMEKLRCRICVLYVQSPILLAEVCYLLEDSNMRR